ncbi:MAG: hypothetical protein JOZ69_21910, partial [Myxococcales bacterium]|nr:hypothetical protein [Myxococcales bacterium]
MRLASHLASAALLLAIAPAAGSCKLADGCDPGQSCVCAEGTECFLGCAGDGCHQDCHAIGTTCGAVCGDRCVSTCHDVPECTFSCGSGCALDCHNVSTCGALCGDGCE